MWTVLTSYATSSVRVLPHPFNGSFDRSEEKARRHLEASDRTEFPTVTKQ